MEVMRESSLLLVGSKPLVWSAFSFLLGELVSAMVGTCGGCGVGRRRTGCRGRNVSTLELGS